MRMLMAVVLVCAAAGWAQEPPPEEPKEAPAEAAEIEAAAEEARAPQEDEVVVPAGTKVPLVLKHALSTKNARVGDNVYLETAFPVVVDETVLIPAGTYVQGRVSNVKRPGRVKGRAEMLIHFNTLVYPNGYTVSLSGGLETVPGAEKSKIKDEEGTLEAEKQTGKDIGTVAQTTATTGTAGALVGLAAGGGKGARIGGGVGAAAGLATALLARGDEVRLEAGSTIEMVFQRPLYLKESRLEAGPQYLPVEKGRRLPQPN